MKKKYYVCSFLVSLLIAFFAIVPYIIDGNGLFTLCGDFNVQQIPFGIYVNKMIKTGNVIYDWCNQLGNSFLESFSFYNLGSVFYWITLLFDADFYPYLIGPILILKFGIAGLTSFAYIQTFCKNKKYALLGSVLYSFSGFQITNIMFNHFHDVVALFPLLLLTLDNLVINNKKSRFCIVLALLAITNYFFFVGQCVFLLLYFICNIIAKRYKFTKKSFMYLSFEVLVGLLISGILLFPSLLNILTSTRVDMAWTLKSALIYDNLIYYADILKSFIMPPDLMFSRTFVSPVNYLSVEQWLPFVGIVLIVPFIKNNKKSFLSYLVVILFVFMFIPILNSSFVGFNIQYYGRWFYMFILILSVCSVVSIENNYKIKSGLISLYIFITLFIIILLFHRYFSNGMIIYNYSMFYINLFIVLFSFVIFLILYNSKVTNFKFILIFVFTIIISFYELDLNIYNSKLYMKNDDMPYDLYYKDNYLNIDKLIDLDLNDNSRIYSNINNINYIYESPTIKNFTSMIDENAVKFYNTIAEEKYKTYYLNKLQFRLDQYYIKTFLSTKYVVLKTFDMDLDSVKNDYNNLVEISYTLVPEDIYKEILKNDDYVVYENKYFLGIGLLYDRYIRVEDFNKLDFEERNSAYLKGVILDDNYIKQYDKKMKAVRYNDLFKNSVDDFKKDYNKIKSNGETTFLITKDGFNVKVNSKKDAMLLLTIPYDTSWSAYNTGKKIPIIEVSNGFMAVKVDEGNTAITFKYKTKGLKEGYIMSLVGITLYTITIIYNKKCKNYN